MAYGRPVLVTTSYRGVFFGYLAERNGDTVVLTQARNCIYWSAECKGFLGLAAHGPTADCRVGPAAKHLELFGVTSISDVPAEAAARWEAAPWS